MPSVGAGRRSERKVATASRLTALARRLTAERGLNGFTIEELCDEVGVSRRTFFNYFPSKEEAVIGVDESEQAERFAKTFLDLGSRGWDSVVDDLVGIAVAHVCEAEIGPADHAAFITAVSREPKLLARFMSITRARDQQITELVAEREGVPIDDARARASVQVVATVMRSASERIVGPNADTDFAHAITESFAALRAVLIPTTTKEPT
ncbi:TetR family transcriptional regulator [Pseudolysinimonas sp.]|uniref:TetR family transcriptional regulator n=1 Tax=Pseudolysinimonas sp. TaxID=2680009 RepID=UPI003783C26D